MKICFILTLGLIPLLCLPVSTMAVSFTVTKTVDTNDGTCDTDCSLREAIVAANSVPTNDIVNFDPTVFSSPQTIALSGGELTIASFTNLTINGPGPDLLTITGNNQSRVLFVGSTWFINRTTAGLLITNFGIPGDVPIPNAFVH